MGRRNHYWRPDEDAKKVSPRVTAEAKRYAKRGLIRAGLRQASPPKAGTPSVPRTCADCGQEFPSKNALVRHRGPEGCPSGKRAMRKLANRIVLMQMRVDPLRPDLGKAPKGSLMAVMLQQAAERQLEARLREDPALVEQLRVPNPAPITPVPNRMIEWKESCIARRAKSLLRAP